MSVFELRIMPIIGLLQGEFLNHIKIETSIEEILIRGRGALPPHDGIFDSTRLLSKVDKLIAFGQSLLNRFMSISAL